MMEGALMQFSNTELRFKIQKTTILQEASALTMLRTHNPKAENQVTWKPAIHVLEDKADSILTFCYTQSMRGFLGITAVFGTLLGWGRWTCCVRF